MIIYVFIGFIIILCAYAITILIKSESSVRQEEKNQQLKAQELSEENQKLEAALRAERLKQDTVETLRQECERLKKEKADTVAQGKQNADLLNEHEKELQRLREESEEKLKETLDVIEALRAQRVAASEQEEDRVARIKIETDQVIEGLKSELNLLAEKKLNFDQESEQLRILNSQFLEREKMIRYDLTRSRAQALGLEKMCEDFKLQIEEMEKSLEKVHAENDSGETL